MHILVMLNSLVFCFRLLDIQKCIVVKNLYKISKMK